MTFFGVKFGDLILGVAVIENKVVGVAFLLFGLVEFSFFKIGSEIIDTFVTNKTDKILDVVTMSIDVELGAKIKPLTDVVIIDES